MLIENEVTLPVPPAEAWPVLLDLEQIAPCLPGAEITAADGDVFEGKAKIKVGPVTAEYKGVAEFVEQNEESHRAVIKATGKDARGQGNVAANITASLVPEGSGSKILVQTDLNITGKLAQFGQGVVQDAAAGIIGTFAERLGKLLASQSGEEDSPGTSAPGQVGEPAASRGTHGEPETLDVLKLARGASTNRLPSVSRRSAALVSVVAGVVSVTAAASGTRSSVVAVVAAGIGSFAAGYSLGLHSSESTRPTCATA